MHSSDLSLPQYPPCAHLFTEVKRVMHVVCRVFFQTLDSHCEVSGVMFQAVITTDQWYKVHLNNRDVKEKKKKKSYLHFKSMKCSFIMYLLFAPLECGIRDCAYLFTAMSPTLEQSWYAQYSINIYWRHDWINSLINSIKLWV